MVPEPRFTHTYGKCPSVGLDQTLGAPKDTVFCPLPDGDEPVAEQLPPDAFQNATHALALKDPVELVQLCTLTKATLDFADWSVSW